MQYTECYKSCVWVKSLADLQRQCLDAHKATPDGAIRRAVGVNLDGEPASALANVGHKLRHRGVATWHRRAARVHHPVGGLVHCAQARRNGHVPGEVVEGHHRGGVLAQAGRCADGEGQGVEEGQLQDLHVEAHVEDVVGVQVSGDERASDLLVRGPEVSDDRGWIEQGTSGS